MTGVLRRTLERAREWLTSRRQPVVEPYSFGYADLRGGGSRIAVIPELGGKLSVLELGGREWLWSNPSLPFRPPVAGSSYVEDADSGGYDECFPTVAACQIPSSVARFGGTQLPDHGELWSQRTKFELRTDGEPSATTTWLGERMPYEFRRSVRVRSDGSVLVEYRVSNSGTDPIPFIWSAHPLLPLTPKTRIILPEGIRARVASEFGIDLGAGAREHRWPHFRLGDRIVDMSRPDAVSKRYACKIFFEMPAVPIAIEEGDMRLEIVASARQIPNLGLWINRGGWSPNRQIAPYRNLALEPCIGAPDSLADALGDWKSAHWLAPGQAREWSITWLARPLTSGTPSARETPAESRLPSR